jgi:hypothetical protein
LEKSYPLPLNILESPSPKDDLCQVWLKLVQWFWIKSRKCKSLQTDRQMDPDNEWSEKLTWAFSSGELKNKNKKQNKKGKSIIFCFIISRRYQAIFFMNSYVHSFCHQKCKHGQ